MSETGKHSIFYGGAWPSGASKGSSNGDKSVPFSGDPLDDLLASVQVSAEQMGYSEQEFNQRLEDYNIVRIRVEGTRIMLGQYVLDELDPACKAFYILLVRHPEGLKLKDLQSDYLEEYLSIKETVGRKRAESRKQKDATVDLAKQGPKYRIKINQAITKLETENGDVNLSSCKIDGGEGKPYAILSLLRENHSLKEL